MKIYAKVTKSFDEGKVKAICDVILNGTFAIHGVRLVEGEKGRFVAMPCQKFGKTPDEVQYYPENRGSGNDVLGIAFATSVYCSDHSVLCAVAEELRQGRL